MSPPRSAQIVCCSPTGARQQLCARQRPGAPGRQHAVIRQERQAVLASRTPSACPPCSSSLPAAGTAPHRKWLGPTRPRQEPAPSAAASRCARDEERPERLRRPRPAAGSKTSTLPISVVTSRTARHQNTTTRQERCRVAVPRRSQHAGRRSSSARVDLRRRDRHGAPARSGPPPAARARPPAASRSLQTTAPSRSDRCPTRSPAAGSYISVVRVAAIDLPLIVAPTDTSTCRWA